jgi:putative hydrolase of the HAD superfamily
MFFYLCINQISKMSITPPIHTLIFDWGDTIMRDFALPGAMKDWPKAEFIEGAEKALKHLSSRFTCIIATSASHSDTLDMIAALELVGAQKYFHHFFSSADLGFQKPAPQFFSAITGRLNLTPSGCVMIGNLYEKDIAPAKVAGLQTVFFNEKNIKGEFPLADAVIDNMSVLPTLF